MNYGSKFLIMHSSLNQGEYEDDLSGNSLGFPKMDFQNYVNKEITFVRSNDIMMYARGEHPQLNIDQNVYLEGWTK